MHRLDILFPRCCPICLKPVIPKGGFLHEACKAKLRFTKSPFCLRCGREIADERAEYCTACKRSDIFFDSGRCTFVYHSETERAIKVFKDEGTEEFADFFGRATAEKDGNFIEAVKPDVIVPVPLHESRLRTRGFNQAELYAKSLSRYMGIPVAGLLKKSCRTKDQKGLDRVGRMRNLKEAFGVNVGDTRVPRKVLLADDIYTTGSTVNSCAAALKAAGVEKVYFVCIAAGTVDI